MWLLMELLKRLPGKTPWRGPNLPAMPLVGGKRLQACQLWPRHASDPGLLGHRSIVSTQRYTALAPGRFKNFWKD
jgi:hypothetical protein